MPSITVTLKKKSTEHEQLSTTSHNGIMPAVRQTKWFTRVTFLLLFGSSISSRW